MIVNFNTGKNSSNLTNLVLKIHEMAGNFKFGVSCDFDQQRNSCPQRFPMYCYGVVLYIFQYDVPHTNVTMTPRQSHVCH